MSFGLGVPENVGLAARISQICDDVIWRGIQDGGDSVTSVPGQMVFKA